MESRKCCKGGSFETIEGTYLPKTNHLRVFQSHNLSHDKINYATHDHSLHVYYVDLKDKFLCYGLQISDLSIR